MKRIVASAAVSAVACFAPALRATVVAINPSQDNTLFQNDDTLSNGAGQHIYVGETGFAGARRALMAFDIASAVPSGATINSATLLLSLTKLHGFGQATQLHRVTASWGEGASDAGDPGGGGTLANTGDATWKYRTYTDTEWTTAGGEFIGQGTTTVFSASATVDNFATLAFASAGLTADVQSWLNTPAGNFGWMIKTDELSAGTANRFASLQNTTPELRPLLTIDYTATPPPTSTYANDADGDWENSESWSGGVPNAANTIVALGNVITAPRTVFLNSARTAGVVSFDSTHRYTISGAGSLTLDGTACALNAIKGSHTVAVPVSLTKNTTVNVNASPLVLSLTAPLSMAAEITLTKSGPGTLEVKHLRGDDVRINGGTVKVLADGTDAAASNIASLTVATGAALDLADNDLVLGEQDSITAENVRQMLVDGKLTSSAATSLRGLGYGDNSVLNYTSFSGQTVDGGNTLVKYTYLGDTDLNGLVDVGDLGSLASAWQTAGLWTSGDFDYNNSIDVNDLGLLASNWQAGVGNPLGASFNDALSSFGLPSASVPEPAAVGLVLAVALKCHRRGRRHRQR